VADLPEALDAALRARYRITEVRTPITQRRGLLARMNQLEKLHTRPGDRPGSAGRRAAIAAGLPPDQWTRWKKGQRAPSAASARKLEGAYNRQITLPAFRKKTQEKKAPNKVTVTAEIWWTDSDKKNNGDQRTVKLTGMRTAMIATIRAWIAAGPEAAAEAFQRGTARVYRVPDNDDGTPGIQFLGSSVSIEFPK
jgi:hypothetical protein